MIGAIQAHLGIRVLRVLFKILPRVFLDLFVFVQSFLKPEMERTGPVSFHETVAGLTDGSHHRNSRLNQSAVLHAQETIREQITFRLCEAKSGKSGQTPQCGRSMIPGTNLQTPQAIREIFTQLNVDLHLLDRVLSKPLTRQALLEFLPKHFPPLFTQSFSRGR